MTNTEETLHESSHAEAWSEELTRSLEEQRAKARALLAAQRERFQSLQSQFTLRLAELADEFSRHESEALERKIKLDSREAAFSEQSGLLARQLEEIQNRHEALRRREEEIERASAGLASRQQLLEQRSAELAQERQRIEEMQRAHKEETEQLTRNMAELHQIQAHYEQQRQALEEREREIARQRRNIARQLRARKKELDTERELMQAEARSSSAGHELQLQQRLSELTGKYERLSEELVHREQQRDELTQRLATLQNKLEQREAECARLAGLEAQVRELEKQRDAVSREREALAHQRDLSAAGLQESLDAAHREAAEQRAAAATARAEAAELARALHEATSASAPPDVAAQLEKLREENRKLAALLGEAESRSSSADPRSSQEFRDLRARLDLAMQECRELKIKSAELQQQLEAAKAGGGRPAAGGVATDWETQKRRLLEQLEADATADEDEARKAEKLSIEETIKRTDEALAQKNDELAAKDREIEDLRRLLEDQSHNIGQMAVGAAAIAEVLDHDELIRQERETLQKLQTELREQLRQAEIELSMERAKIARERMEIEEKLHAFEKEKASLLSVADAQGPAAAGKKPARGRWLERLGLRDGGNGT
jgi:chromosome segregation ATPase